MAERWKSDAAVEDHYRDRWRYIHGYDPLDPDDEVPTDAEIENEIANEKYDRRERD